MVAGKRPPSQAGARKGMPSLVTENKGAAQGSISRVAVTQFDPTAVTT
jgi:hypothetical protein